MIAPREKRDYDVRPLETDPKALDEVLALFARGDSPIPGGQAFLDWQYNANPAGHAVGFNAYYQGALVAHYVTIPIHARLFGRRTLGLLSINTRTDAEHQNQGLFKLLADLTYARGKETGHDFVVGVANRYSVPGFTRKLGFQLVGRLETRFVLWPRPTAPRDYAFETDWDAAAIAWRLANPTKQYYVRRYGKRALLFGHSSRFRALIGAVDSAALPEAIPCLPALVSPLNLWLGMNGDQSLKRALHLRVPERFRSVPLNLIFRDLVGERTLNPEDVKYWAMDFDAY